MNTVNNYQHHDAMQTGHTSLAFRATTKDGQPVESSDMSNWMRSAKLTLGEAVQEYIDKHYGLFYYTTSLMHEEYVDLGLPARRLEEGEAVVHSQVALRPLGLDADARRKMRLSEVEGRSAVKNTHADLAPRSVRRDVDSAKEPSIGPGSLKVMVRFDTSGREGFGGADSFLGFVSSEDAFAAVPRSETPPWSEGSWEPESRQPGSARYYALGNPATEGTYSKITLAQMEEKVRPLETMWKSAPEWWKRSAAESDRQDSKFLPIDEVCEPADQTKERSKLYRRFLALGGAPEESGFQDPVDYGELPEPSDELSGPSDELPELPPLGATGAQMDTAAPKRGGEGGSKEPKKPKPGPKKTKATDPAQPSKRAKADGELLQWKPYPPRSNPKNLTTRESDRIERDTYWSALYVTIYDYDDFVIAKAACDEEFAWLMHANPHWYNFKDTYELRGGRIEKRVSWQPWVPTSGVDGDTCKLKSPRPLDWEDEDLPNYFPFLNVYPTRDVAGQHMWNDGCSKRVPGDAGKFAQRPTGRFWNSWMHDRARFGTSDETARAFEEEVKDFQAAFERFEDAQRREDQAGALEDVVKEQIARQLEDSRFVTWMELLLRRFDEKGAFSSASLVYALAESGARLERVRRTLYSFQEHRRAFTDAQRAELLQRGLRSVHCISEVPDEEYNSIAEGLYSRTPSLQDAVQTVLRGFCVQPLVSMGGSDRSELDVLNEYYSVDRWDGEEEKDWVQSWDKESKALLPNCELYNLAPLPVPTRVTGEDGKEVERVKVLFVPAAVQTELVIRVASAENREAAMDQIKEFARNVQVDWQGDFAQQMAAVQFLGRRLQSEVEKAPDWKQEQSRVVDLPLVRLLAERLSRDSILAARQSDTAVSVPVIGGLVLDPVDGYSASSERDRRARVVMSVIRLADPFLRETLLLERLLETGIEADEIDNASLLLPSGTDIVPFYDNGAYRAVYELERQSSDMVEFTKFAQQLVEHQVDLMARGLAYPKDDQVTHTAKKAGEIQEWWTAQISGPEEALQHRGEESLLSLPEDYDKADDLGLWGYGLDPRSESGDLPGKGATDYELLRGNLYDDKLNYLTPEFSGGEVYGPKGAYVRYIYDMVRPLFGKGRDRLREHLSDSRRTFDLELHGDARRDDNDVLVGADGVPLVEVPAVMPVTYSVFRRTILAQHPYLDLGAAPLPHPGAPGSQGTLSTRPEFVASADLRYPMQSQVQDPLAPSPALQIGEAELELLSSPQFQQAYADYVDYERLEVKHAATEEQRSELERDFASRMDMEFPKGCTPHLGVLHVSG